MYKKIFFFLIISLLSFSFLSAEEDFVTVSTKIDATKINNAAADLNMVDVSFCEVPGEKEINYLVPAGGKKKMCLEITNSSDVTLPITVSFVDAILTNDQRANEACQTEDRENIFPSYITDYDKNITLEAGEHITIYPLVSFPKDLLTGVNACLVYYLQPTELGGQFNFSVLVRKAKFIHIHITDPVQRKLSDRWGLLVGIGLGIFFLLVINRKKK